MSRNTQFHLQFQEYRDAMFLIEITKNEFQFVVVNEVLNPSVKTFSESLEYENVNPSYYGMVAIQRVELSEGQHHIGSYFSDHVGIQTEKESLKATAAKGGITVLNHPSLNQ